MTDGIVDVDVDNDVDDVDNDVDDGDNDDVVDERDNTGAWKGGQQDLRCPSSGHSALLR